MLPVLACRHVHRREWPTTRSEFSLLADRQPDAGGHWRHLLRLLRALRGLPLPGSDHGPVPTILAVLLEVRRKPNFTQIWNNALPMLGEKITETFHQSFVIWKTTRLDAETRSESQPRSASKQLCGSAVIAVVEHDSKDILC